MSLARLHAKAPDLAHTVHYADLARIPEMKRVAAEIASQEPRIDVLINNAGAMFANRQLTEDDLECTFALNHMAYFVITEGLRERLLASAPARIVSTASAAHQGARLDFDDLQLAKSFGLIRLRPVGCKVPFGANSDEYALQRGDTLQKERSAEITSIDLVPQVGSVLFDANLSQFLR